MTVSADIDETLEEYGFSSEICAIMITGSGYRKLTHRDFLGSLLGLGLERAVIGDILVTDENGREAVVLCDTTICGFIESELSCVANDKVRVKRLQNGEWEAPARRTVALHDTVASPRIDAVVSAICGISREKAREAVVSGLVEIDFEREERPDKTVGVPSVVSVRGVGKFKINSLSDKTKKGRYRLEAEKYV
jgi:RNA-binding protein YlmH